MNAINTNLVQAKEALLLKKSKDLFCIQKQKSPLRGWLVNL
jgi:hypothetical protein